MVSRLGSYFLRAANRARSCAADMFKSSPELAAAVSVDTESGRVGDVGVIGVCRVNKRINKIINGTFQFFNMYIMKFREEDFQS